MIFVGLTGGFGSGKTTVANIFQILGVPVYFSDLRAKCLMSTNSVLKSTIIENFGENAYRQDGSLNRQYLASSVFANKEKLAILNHIVHPAVREDFANWAGKQNNPYVINESAILIESGLYKQMHKIISVLADEKLRIKRAVDRDRISEQQARERIQNQTNDETRKKYSDYIITNDQHMLIEQVINTHTELWEISRNG
jgi:dephospho-CoA kinase